MLNLMSTMQTRKDLPFILNELGLTGIGVELGVQRGEYSQYLLANWHGEKLYLIDSWRHFDNYKDVANVAPEKHLDFFAMTFMNTYRFFEKAVIIKDLSLDASRLFKDSSLDFVFIDANHSYESVKADVNYPSLKGGASCFTDSASDSPSSGLGIGLSESPQA